MRRARRAKRELLLPKIRSLADLRQLARVDDHYRVLACVAASNLGGSTGNDLDKAMYWLKLNAEETDSEQGVVAEVNACRDLIGVNGLGDSGSPWREP